MTYSLTFQAAVKGVLQREGVYAFDAADPGGETNRGITKRNYPDLDIAAITDDQATEIYWRDYWTALSCDALPAVVALKLFDVAVNCGQQMAVVLLQRALNYLGHGIMIDGILGPKTRMAVLGARKGALVCAMAGEQYQRYQDLIRRNPQLKTFAAGWAIRSMACLPREQS